MSKGHGGGMDWKETNADLLAYQVESEAGPTESDKAAFETHAQTAANRIDAAIATLTRYQEPHAVIAAIIREETAKMPDGAKKIVSPVFAARVEEIRKTRPRR